MCAKDSNLTGTKREAEGLGQETKGKARKAGWLSETLPRRRFLLSQPRRGEWPLCGRWEVWGISPLSSYIVLSSTDRRRVELLDDDRKNRPDGGCSSPGGERYDPAPPIVCWCGTRSVVRGEARKGRFFFGCSRPEREYWCTWGSGFLGSVAEPGTWDQGWWSRARRLPRLPSRHCCAPAHANGPALLG